MDDYHALVESEFAQALEGAEKAEVRSQLLGVLVGVQFCKVVDDIQEGRAYISSVEHNYESCEGLEVETAAVSFERLLPHTIL